MDSIDDNIATFCNKSRSIIDRRSALSAIYDAIPIEESRFMKFASAIRMIADSDVIVNPAFERMFNSGIAVVLKQFETSSSDLKPPQFIAEMIRHRVRVVSGSVICMVAWCSKTHPAIVDALTQVCHQNDAVISHGFVTIRGVAFRTLAKLSPTAAAPFWQSDLRLDAIRILRKWIAECSPDLPILRELRNDLLALEDPKTPIP